MRKTHYVLTRSTTCIGYAFNEGWVYVNGELAYPPAPTRPQVVGTAEFILAICQDAERRYPSICRYFIGDRIIDDSRSDPATWLRWLVEGVVDEVTVALLTARNRK